MANSNVSATIASLISITPIAQGLTRLARPHLSMSIYRGGYKKNTTFLAA